MLEEYLGTVSWSLQDLSSKVAALEDTLKRDAPAVDSPELGNPQSCPGAVACLQDRSAGPRRCTAAGMPCTSSEKDAKLAQKLGQLQPSVAVFPQECAGQLASFGPT